MAHRILVIRLGSLGDVILTSPTVLNLKLSFPESRLVFFTKEQFAPIAANFDGVDEVLSLPAQSGISELYQTIQTLNKDRFDLIVDLHGNIRSWFTRMAVSASTKVVYPKRRLERRLIVKRKQFPSLQTHTIDSYNAPHQQLGISTPCRRPILTTRGLPDVSAGIGAGLPYVVVAPGAAHLNKQWPIERFAEVALRLSRERALSVAWVVTSSDKGKSGLESKIPTGGFLELVDEPIGSLTQIIAGAHLTISNDSGLMHLSSAVGTPVLGLFGPTHPALGFAPRGIWDRMIEVDEPCRPCSLHGKKACYRSERFCFTRISPEMVFDEASAMLGESDLRSPALFLDRDGTVIVDKDYLADPDKLELIPGVATGMAEAQKRGYKLVILSNQSGVARGLFDLATVERVNHRLKEVLACEGVTLDGIYYCPHYAKGSVPEFSIPCTCRKPAPGMAEQAARELRVDLKRSWVIGDKEDDLNLGRVLGASSILVRTGHGAKTEQQLNQRNVLWHGTAVSSLPEGIKALLQKGPV